MVTTMHRSSINDKNIERDELNCIEKEAYSHIALHIASAENKDLKQFLVLSNRTDVAMYILANCLGFKTTNVDKLWVKFGIDESPRHIPVYQLAEILGTERLRAMLKEQILTGCDVTSKIESKSAACKACPEKHFYDFGEDTLLKSSNRILLQNLLMI